MGKIENNVWSFVDLFLLLSIVFLYSAHAQNTTAKASHAVPKLMIYLEASVDGKYPIKCNDRYVNLYELGEIIDMSEQEELKEVEVYASVDGSVAFGFVSKVRKSVLRPRKKLKVTWKDNLMINIGR